VPGKKQKPKNQKKKQTKTKTKNKTKQKTKNKEKEGSAFRLGKICILLFMLTTLKVRLKQQGTANDNAVIRRIC